jgi:hypothetical protein
VAQLFAVSLVPGAKDPSEKLTTSMAPNGSSLDWVVVAVVPLEGEVLVPLAPAVWSKGDYASPGTKKARASRVSTPVHGPPLVVTVIVEPDASSEVMAGAEQMTVRVELPGQRTARLSGRCRCWCQSRKQRSLPFQHGLRRRPPR